jgi:hypothetical protein
MEIEIIWTQPAAIYLVMGSTDGETWHDITEVKEYKQQTDLDKKVLEL